MFDSEGRSIHVGKEIGRGGEGSIFEVRGEDSLVAKVYHKTPLPDEQIAKLEAMVGCWSNMLGSIAAWPKSMLCDSCEKKPCGFLMPKVVGARQLHELYGTTNRRAHFPDAQWHYLILAARNTAAAFDMLHKSGIIVGDVNQGNVLVDDQMRVHLIDCDSFQITIGGKTFHCPVGTPHFTPPELQSKKLKEVPRTIDHDGFGLAVLAFHLIFVGRHPFAGRYRGAGDLTIEKAIAERRFAFSTNRSETLVDPPPASLWLTDLPNALAGLFERAFRENNSNGSVRPQAQQWVEQLDGLIRQRTTCKIESAHTYFSSLQECPWCRIEDEGGPAFFGVAGGTSRISLDRLESLDARLRLLGPFSFPDLTSRRLELPHMPLLKKLEKVPKLTSLDVAAALLAVSCCLCLLGIVAGQALTAGVVLSIASGCFLIFSKLGRDRRKEVADFHDRMTQIQNRFLQMTRTIVAGYLKRKSEFGSETTKFDREFETYEAKGDQLQEVLRLHRMTNKDDFLRKFLIRDTIQHLPGMTSSLVSMLESFGVESALDVDELTLTGVPVITPDIELELLQWRSQLEQKFVFRPDHGVTAQDLKADEELATKRFKVMQARKVLMAATRLKSQENVAKSELDKGLAKLDSVSSEWLKVAKSLRDFQSGRRELERSINRSLTTTVGIALGIPLIGLILHLLFR